MNSPSVVDPERFLGSVQWRQFDMDEQIQVQLARLESDVGHINREVADIKVDLRRTNDKIDATNLRFDVLRDKVEQGFRDVHTRIGGVQENLSAKIDGVQEKLNAKIDGVQENLSAKIDGVQEKLNANTHGVQESLNAKIDGVQEKLSAAIEGLRQDVASAKVWAMGLYFALSASLLFVMAKGFHWL